MALAASSEAGTEFTLLPSSLSTIHPQLNPSTFDPYILLRLKFD